MKRSIPATIAAVLGATALAVPASAELAELGKPEEGTTPACPAKPCLAVSRTTGYQVKVGDNRALYTVPKDGRIVAWSLTLGKPGKSQTKYFNDNLGGEAQAQLTVLRPGNKLYARVLAQGEPQKLTKYFGSTVQFPLEKSIPVSKGNIIALTVPTWAPALAVGQPATSSWRGSRGKGECDSFSKPTAQTGTGNVARWYCLYKTARLTYSATIVSNPVPTADQPAATTEER